MKKTVQWFDTVHSGLQNYLGMADVTSLLFAIWVLVPALASLGNLKGIALESVFGCQSIFEAVQFPACRAGGPYDWAIYVLTLPIVDWLAFTLFISLVFLLLNLFVPGTVMAFPSQNVSPLHLNKVLATVSASISRCESTIQVSLEHVGARLESVSNQVYQLLAVLNRPEVAHSPLKSALSGAQRLALSTTHKPSKSPRPSHMTIWIQGKCYGMSSLESCMRIALELDDSEALEKMAFLHRQHGSRYQSSVNGANLYCFGPKPSCLLGSIHLWVNYGGQYGSPAEHAENLKSYLWIPLDRGTMDDNVEICNCSYFDFLLSRIECYRQIPRAALSLLQRAEGLPIVLKETSEYVVINKPSGWLCSGADEDLRKSLPTPPGIDSLGIETDSDLIKWTVSERGPPMIDWFLQVRFPKENAFFDPAINFGLCSRLDSGRSGVLLIVKGLLARHRYQQASSGGLIQKRYLAVVQGEGPQPCTVASNFRDRTIVLHSEMTSTGRALVHVEMIGGRRHQIR